MPAFLRQQHLNGARCGRGNQGSMMPRMSGLGTRLALALVLSAGGPLLSSEAGGGNQGSMMPRMSGLGTRLALALVLSAARSLLSGQSVGGRWLGGVGRVLLPSSQLPLQIGDLLFGVRDLLFGVRDLFIGVRDLLFVFGNLTFAFRHFTAEFFVLAQQPLILPIQLFTAELVGVPMAIRHYLWLPCPASRSRTHP